MLKSKATIRYLSIFVTTKMINEVGTVAKSNKKIVAIEAKTDTRSLFWLGRGFSIKGGGVKLFK